MNSNKFGGPVKVPNSQARTTASLPVRPSGPPVPSRTIPARVLPAARQPRPPMSLPQAVQAPARFTIQRKLTIVNDDGFGRGVYDKLVIQIPRKGPPNISNPGMKRYLRPYPEDWHREMFERLNAWASSGEQRFNNWPEALEAAAAPLQAAEAAATQRKIQEANRRAAIRPGEYDAQFSEALRSLAPAQPPTPLPPVKNEAFVSALKSLEGLGELRKLPTDVRFMILDLLLHPQRIGHDQLGSAGFIGNAKSWPALSRVSIAFRRMISDWANQRGVSVAPDVLKRPKMHTQQLDQWSAVAESIISQFPPDSHIYVLPGASMIPAVAFIRKAYPSATIIHMPVSGLSKDAMERESRKPEKLQRDLRPEAVSLFYWAYLRPWVEELRSGRKFLALIDYSPSGRTLDIMRRHIEGLLSDVGFLNAASVIKLLKFSSTTQLNGISPATAGRLAPGWQEQLAQNLQNERFKFQNQLVLYKTKSDFHGCHRSPTDRIRADYTPLGTSTTLP